MLWLIFWGGGFLTPQMFRKESWGWRWGWGNDKFVEPPFALRVIKLETELETKPDLELKRRERSASYMRKFEAYVDVAVVISEEF